MKKTLRALSVAQPWAECIVGQGKNVENRGWTTKHRGYVAIHASRSLQKGRFDACEEIYGLSLDPDALPFGAIVGFAELVKVISEGEVTAKTRRWFMGEYGFVLRGAVRLPRPVPVKGALNFWRMPVAVQRKALGQLNPRAAKKIEAGAL